jgi:antitoxin HicB
MTDTVREFVYPAGLIAAPEGGYTVSFRDLPEAITEGDSLEEALEEAVGALQAALEGRIMDELDLPQPSRPRRGEHLISAPIQTALKAALALEMRRAGITRVELARRLELDEKEVRRMLDPYHPSKADRLERALAVLGKRVELRVA